MARLGPVMAGNKLLLPVHEKADGSASLLREHRGDDMVGFQAVFTAKSPAGVFIDDAYVVDGQPQGLSQAVFDHVDPLIGVPQD